MIGFSLTAVELPEDLASRVESLQMLFAGIGVVVGLLYLTLGYRIFKIMLAILGGLLGLLFGAAGGYACAESTGAIVGAVVGAALGAVLLYVLYFVGVFILGGLLGGGLAYAYLMQSTGTEEPGIAIIAALACGVVALLLQKFFLICGTSFTGATMIVGGIYTLLDKPSFHAQLFEGPDHVEPASRALMTQGLIILAVMVLGIIVQYVWTGKKPKATGKQAAEGAPAGKPSSQAPAGRPTGTNDG